MAIASPIQVSPDNKLFVFRLASSFYALRVTNDGQMVHVGSGPLPEGSVDVISVDNIGQYEDSNYVWDPQGRKYELPTFGDYSFHAVALKVSFPQPSGAIQPNEAAHLPVRDLRLRYVDHSIRTDASPALATKHGLSTRVTSARQTLCIRTKDIAYDFFVTLCYRITPEQDVIERWIELDNRTGTAVSVEQLSFGCVHLPNGSYDLLQASGCWAREFVTATRPLEQGLSVLNQQGLNTGHFTNPSFVVYERGQATEESGTVFFGGLAYSGNWQLTFDVQPTTATRIFGGYEAGDFELTLHPNDTHTTPAFVHGVSSEGIGGASRRLHRFIRERVLPTYDGGSLRPVLYNNWEATYFNFNHELLVNVARKAAEIGCELFTLDDGWFGARRNDKAGLGDWFVSPDVLPNGLKPIADEVHALGMLFGLWFEPEMVNPDSDLYRAHPDWVLHFPGRPRTEARQQLILDFGRKEVVDYLLQRIDAVVGEVGVDFIKWDMNRYVTEPGSVSGKRIWRDHVAGVYHIMDELRRKHPKLSIQSCSGGGGRVDLGMLGRTDQVWTSDNTDAYDRVFIEDGFSLIYPARTMESWVTHEHNHQTGRHATAALRFDVAMRGALGIGPALNRMTEEELAVFTRKIAFYKRIRPTVHDGDLYRLQTTRDGRGASIWQFVSDDKKQAVYSIVVVQALQGYHRAHPKLRGLNPMSNYAITNDEGKDLGTFSGTQLMALGLPGDTVYGHLTTSIYSRTLLLTVV